jgi:F-type H+-transporting ATPase subunit epsilon
MTAEAPNGYFTLLPRHIDFATILVPGILSYQSTDDKTHYLAVDEGVLVKQGEEVTASVRNAIAGESLEKLEETVEQTFKALSEREKSVKAASAKLEAAFTKHLLEK